MNRRGFLGLLGGAAAALPIVRLPRLPSLPVALPPVSSEWPSFGDDLWGATWTPAQINAADFGVAIAAHHTGDFHVPAGATILGVTITVQR